MKSRRIQTFLITLLIVFMINLAHAYAPNEWLSYKAGTIPASPEVTVIDESPDHLLIRYRFQGVYIQPIETVIGTFQRVSLGESAQVSTAEVGHPELPGLVKMIHVPDGCVASASAQSVEWHNLGRLKPYPNQYPYRYNESRPEEFAYSEKAYSSDITIPENPVSAMVPQGWGGIAVSSIALTPFRYTPLSEELEIASEIEVRIDFVPGEVQDIIKPDIPSLRMLKLHQTALLNPPDLPEPLDVDENEPVRMLVVVREEALETIQPLIDYHHNTGMRVELWLADDIEEPQEIKDRVTEIYDDTGLDYLFIVGDGYEDDWDVPMFYWEEVDPGRPVDDTDSYSDTWFACLDGLDQDGYDDHFMDIAVGRLVYEGMDNIDELEIQVEKLMNYYMWTFENPDDFEWLDRALLIGSGDLVDGERVYLHCKQIIENHDYQLAAPEFLTAYGNVNGVNNNTILNIVGEVGVGIVNYRGHGTDNRQVGWNLQNQDITVATVHLMENSQRPFIHISSACKTGNIATFGQVNNDCLMEAYQKHDGGAICAHGSIISSFTDANSFFDQHMFFHWFDDGVYDLGFSMVISAAEMVAEYDPTAYPTQGRTNLRTYIWEGDPSLEIRQGRPMELEVAIEDTIPIGSRRISAFITSDDEPVGGVRFCVRTEDDEIYQVGYTDPDGELTIEFDNAIDEAQLLHWGVYHRNGIPAYGEILAADGFGVIYGQITDFADNSPIEDASVLLSRFEVNAETDANGNYRIEGIPEGEYTLTSSAEGFLPQTREVQVTLDEDLEVNFALLFSELTLDSAEIRMYLEEGEQGERNLSFTNTGNGPLTWSANLDIGGDMLPFEMIRSYDASLEIGDTRLNGAVFIYGQFYIAGGNRNGDPNYLYVMDRNGRQIDVFRLPDEIAGIGLHDLAWDGQYLYGSSNDEILAMNLEGEIQDRFDGPFNPNVALAVDDEGCLWVGNNNNMIYRVDTDGNILAGIPNGYAVRALAWFPDEPDGYKLQMLVRGGEDNPVSLCQMNVDTRTARMVTNLTINDGEIPGDGLFVTDRYNPVEWVLVSMINQEDLRFLRLWHLDYRSSWLSFEPMEGTLEPGSEQEITLFFDTADYENGLILNGIMEFESDGAEPLIEVPVTLQIGAGAVPEDGTESQPNAFQMGNAHPNPFNAETQISIYMPHSGRLTVALYDINGRLVQTLQSGTRHPGRHLVQVDAKDLSSGIYLVVANLDNSTSIRKIALIR